MTKKDLLKPNSKAVMYVRVSSKEQEKGGFSIPAQIKLLTKYAVDNGLNVVKIFQEAETAKQAGRKKFQAMLKYLKDHSDVKIILVEKTDRLYRNLKDYIVLDEIQGLEIILVKESCILTDFSSNNDKFMHRIKVILAQQYIENLSEEVRKGQREKAEEGIYPSKAPVGYKNVEGPNGKRIIVVDHEQAPFVRRAFELYATGNYSANTINTMLYKEGFRTKGGNKFAKSTIERMFKNIFYIGKFEYRGYVCENAQHEAIIDVKTFKAIQNRLNSLNRARTHDLKFPYQGFLKCSSCGGILSPELKRGKYVYYHCSDYHRKGCKKLSYINQDKLDKAIADILSRLKFDKSMLNGVLQTVMELHEKKNSYQRNCVKTINAKISRLQKLIEKSYIDKCEGVIDEEFWRIQNKKWRKEKNELMEQLSMLDVADEQFYMNCEQLLSFAKNAHEMFLKGSIEDKSFITKLVISKITYYNKKLDIELYPVFNSLLKKGNKIATLEQAEMQTISTKKAPEGANFKNGGNDEARTRDLMRDRHAL